MRITTLGLISLSFLLLGSGCLKTRAEIYKAGESNAMQDRVSVLQRQVADRNVEIDQINEDLRVMAGRIEVLEADKRKRGEQSNQDAQNLDQKIQDLSRQIGLLEQEMVKLSNTVATLQRSQSSAPRNNSSNEDQGNFGGAQVAFNNKNWRDAILGYEKYRELNPKGQSFAEATYKIGFSFEQLGMAPEAKAFYEEVVAKFPKTSWANQARTRLKSL